MNNINDSANLDGSADSHPSTLRSGQSSSGPVQTSWAALSVVGNIRKLNEDSFLANSPVFIVADGMGGHEAGELASAAAVAAFESLCQEPWVDPYDCIQAIDLASHQVHALARGTREPGSTLTGAVLSHQDGQPYWLVINIGDSRTYLVRNGVAQQITEDHSVVQEMVSAGEISLEEAQVSTQRNIVTRALGAGSGLHTKADIWMIPIATGDRLVVCSDGLSGEVSSQNIAKLVVNDQKTAEVTKNLINEALDAGGKDNITVLVVDVVGLDSEISNRDPIEVNADSTRDLSEAGHSVSLGQMNDDTLPKGISLEQLS